jgi:hypothetical protein
MEDVPNVFGLCWNNEDFESARKELLAHYTAQQNGQSSRLLGMVVGLFTLLQLTQLMKNSPLGEIFTSFPAISPYLSPYWTDLLKVIFLSAGVWLVLLFLLRSIFRFSVYGHMASSIIGISKEKTKFTIVCLAKTVERQRVEKDRSETIDHVINHFKCCPIGALHVAVSKEVHGKLAFGLPLKLFLPTDNYLCPNRENIGYIALGLLAVFLTVLFLLFLW